jgi:hypothetical protein
MRNNAAAMIFVVSLVFRWVAVTSVLPLRC